MFYELYSKRKQVRWYDQDRTPDKSIVDAALRGAYEAVASKQNLMPYKIYVINNNQVINQKLYDVSQDVLPTKSANYNLLTAPYQFIYTVRLAGGNSKVKEWVTSGHLQPCMNPDQYKDRFVIKNTNLEIGMHATVLTKLLVEQGIDVSYTLCFPSNMPNDSVWKDSAFTFLEDEVQFIMSAGYEDPERYYNSKEDKPNYNQVVQWIED
jgi:hypothetical protein